MAQLEKEREAFLRACKKVPSGQREMSQIADALSLLIEWSLGHPELVVFRSTEGSEQAILSFDKVADQNVCWAAYSDTKGSRSKVEFLTRSPAYELAADNAAMRRRIHTDLGIVKDFDESKVPVIPLASIAREPRRSTIPLLLEWMAGSSGI